MDTKSHTGKELTMMSTGQIELYSSMLRVKGNVVLDTVLQLEEKWENKV